LLIYLPNIVQVSLCYTQRDGAIGRASELWLTNRGFQSWLGTTA